MAQISRKPAPVSHDKSMQGKSVDDWSVGISIILPTFRRPEGLRTALKSLSVQSLDERPIELIIANNDPQATARLQVAQFAKTASFPVHYIHVPEPGVANARNEALKAAKGRYLAFLDDDQYARGNWLVELLDVMETYDAGLAFCPTHARSPVDLQFKSECLSFFTRNIYKATPGPVDEFFGCGNSLLDTELCRLPNHLLIPARMKRAVKTTFYSHLLKTKG